MSELPTEESFLKDVATHEMAVLHDDGLYRHLRFQKPKSWNMGFDITTWPGFLCYSGDMGCYVFSRLRDMLVFFRADGYERRKGLFINPDYWGEKIHAVDRSCPVEEFSEEKFKSRIREWLDDREASPAVRAAVDDEVLSRVEYGGHEAMRAAYEFEHDGFQFTDFWEVNVNDYSYRYIWCCYALAWAVRKYDEHKRPAEKVGASHA